MNNYKCLVIWTFHDDDENRNSKNLIKILDDFNFEEIDQSTRGTKQDIDFSNLVDKLKHTSFIFHKGDFIKIAHTNSPIGIIVESVYEEQVPLNEQHIRIIEIMNKI